MATKTDPAVVVAVDELILVAEDPNDSCYDNEEFSDTTSISSSLREYVLENGRRYQRGDVYVPNDETDQERLDGYHHLQIALLGDKLHRTKLGREHRRILDCGTGTGIWALDVASEHPQAVVTGVDISPIQPSWAFPNVNFEVYDLEKPWTWPENHFDFIHSRTMLTSIRDWGRYTTEMYRHTTPGGLIELSENEFVMHCDDGSYTSSSAIHKYMTAHKLCSEKAGIDMATAADLERYLQEAGFVDVQATPMKTPWGAWPRDRRMKRLGAIVAMLLGSGLEAYGLALFTRAGNMSLEEAKKLIDDAYKEVLSRKVHAYNLTWVITARKPKAA